MVDEKLPELIDHLGWRLWRAARLWKAEFDSRMNARGLSWYTEGRASMIAQIGDNGIRQSGLVRRLGLTKQAVQQIIDELATEEIVSRRPDPSDNRGRIIALTPKGIAAAHAANEVKREIEAAQRQQLGTARFDALMDTLRDLAPDAGEDSA
ncbi:MULTISPECIES: MarR family transcriptional regulator [unclassified Beijerinckia]|uniref:MarR family winged helix-turn-helix transcriptional regulator n=1 Tax=unclassified Beijerinckia TaxID=2638183 RepID=UPI00089CF397|nr:MULTISPECIES: MarR family transcriptional regulator [unclassified Beijerinckia]MDH7795726.1 DNA-binding MarR family transcriptional regulator [Beijerinckia sp. GAS462]SEC13536.1 MarR family transcriptional regulator, transcriptional regulator for hemolysin [Beijerinckia sp. 28-YEA-48]